MGYWNGCPICGSCSATLAVRSSPRWDSLSTDSIADQIWWPSDDVNPRDYLGRFWIDSITPDADLLEYVLKLQELIGFARSNYLSAGDLDLGASCSTWDSKKTR